VTKEEQISFVEALSKTICDGITTDINLGLIPEAWEGQELRQLFADRYKKSVTLYMTIKRKREYQNTKLINNL
jgi:hypothetical protein